MFKPELTFRHLEDDYVVTHEDICFNFERLENYILQNWDNLKFKAGYKFACFNIEIHHPGTFRWEKLPEKVREK